MPFLRVPRDRVVDAAPVALVLILLSAAWIIPVAAPASMLHIWLWLRHPRSKSRYLIFACVTVLFLSVFIGLPLIGNHLLSQNSGGRHDRYFGTGHIPMMLMAFSAAGILPILYRLLSRCSLTASGNPKRENVGEESRAGISDLFALSLLCAIVFVVGRIPEEQFGWSYAPAWDLVATFVFSTVGLIAMRLCARCSRAAAFANFLLVWIGGLAVLKLTFWGLKYAQQEWLDNPEWLAINYTRQFESQLFGAAMMFVALFPIICRRCGVALLVNRPADTKSDKDADVALDADGKSPQDGTTSTGFFGTIGQLLGHVALVAMIALVTLYPFTWTEKYTDAGYRIAGWPLPYWTAQQLTGSEAPWYWTDSEIWASGDVRTMPLVIDILVTVIAWMLVLPIRPIRNLLTPRGIHIGRIGLATLFIALLSYSIVGEPYFRNRGLDSIDGVTINHYESDPKLGLFATIAYELDTNMRGTSGRAKRGRPADVTIENASPETIDKVLALFSLDRVVIRESELLPRHVEQILRHPSLRVLELQNCDVLPKTVERFVWSGNLRHFIFESDNDKFTYGVVDSLWRDGIKRRDELELTTRGGEIFVPDSVRELTLIVPNHVDSRITLTGSQNLYQLWLQNTVGEIPESVCQLTIAGAPTLFKIKTDNYQKVDLTIDSAPLLNSVYGTLDSKSYYEARLTSLTISGPTQLEILSVDISECEHLDLDPGPSGLQLGTLHFSGHSGLRREDSRRLPVDTLKKLIRQMPPGVSADYLTFHGLEIDSEVLQSLPTTQDTLELIDCRIIGETTEESFRRLNALTELHAVDFAPNDRQLIQLIKLAPNLEELHISGANLSKLPPLLGRRLLVAKISDLKLQEGQSRGFDWRKAHSLSLRNSNLTDEDLATWLLPEMCSMDLIGSRVTADGVEAMHKKWPLLEEIILSKE